MICGIGRRMKKLSRRNIPKNTDYGIWFSLLTTGLMREKNLTAKKLKKPGQI